jgi:ascorbate-specific PTS system EIIC-type component UlaA
MKAEQIFSIANMIALLAWLFLLVAPRWTMTRKVILSGAIPLLLSTAYLVLIVLFFGKAEGGFDSLANVMKLFTNEWAALAGWIHYLAFDLLVGTWEVKDSQARGISHWFVIPGLILTFLLGPIGFLLYIVLRTVTGKKEVKND